MTADRKLIRRWRSVLAGAAMFAAGGLAVWMPVRMEVRGWIEDLGDTLRADIRAGTNALPALVARVDTIRADQIRVQRGLVILDSVLQTRLSEIRDSIGGRR